jgi:hypothetical protein
MVVLDMANSRMKDFLDLWTIAQGHELSGKVVAQAVAATFERRATPIPGSPPIGLTEAFYGSPVKQTQWAAFLRKSASPQHLRSSPWSCRRCNNSFSPFWISIDKRPHPRGGGRGPLVPVRSCRTAQEPRAVAIPSGPRCPPTRVLRLPLRASLSSRARVFRSPAWSNPSTLASPLWNVPHLEAKSRIEWSPRLT